MIFSTGGTPYTNGMFGPGTGPIAMESVACFYTSSQLLACPSNPLLTSTVCTHSDDAGVGCEGTYGLISLISYLHLSNLSMQLLALLEIFD